MRFLTFIFKNLMRRKTRSALTTVGMSVAVGTTVALLGVSNGFTSATLTSLEGRDVDIVVLEKGAVDQLTSDIDEEAMRQALELPGVQATSPGLIDMGAFDVDGSTMTVPIQGWDPESYVQDALTFTAGRRMNVDDANVAIVGQKVADNLEKKLGDAIEIEGEDFEVIGIYDSLTPIENACLAIPLKQFQRVQLREGRLTAFTVRLDRSDGNVSAEKVRDAINELHDAEGNPYRLEAQLTKDYVSGSSHLQAARAMAWLTSTIAIFVGTIGMLNTMIMSVVERVREISILRAIGWRRFRVVNMILSESLILSIVGAIVGCAGAVLVTRFLGRLPAANGIIQGPIAAHVHLLGFTMAIAVGVIGGLYPALRASNLQPVEGLRRD